MIIKKNSYVTNSEKKVQGSVENLMKIKYPIYLTIFNVWKYLHQIFSRKYL